MKTTRTQLQLYTKTYISFYLFSPLNDMWAPLVSIFFLLSSSHLPPSSSDMCGGGERVRRRGTHGRHAELAAGAARGARGLDARGRAACGARGLRGARDLAGALLAIYWWKSGPKGGRRHNSPLSSLPPFACFRKASTSTCARRGNAKLNRTVKETRKYSADRRPKDQQMPSVLSSHYTVSVSLQGVHYL
jgi:hypothetical protein